MKMNYIKDMLRSGVSERAKLIKRPYENNEFGDPEYIEDEREEYEFKTIVDNLDRAENETEAGDYIEGDMRLYVSPDCDITFVNGDFIQYEGRKFNVTEVRNKTLGSTANHKEVIVENV